MLPTGIKIEKQNIKTKNTILGIINVLIGTSSDANTNEKSAAIFEGTT